MSDYTQGGWWRKNVLFFCFEEGQGDKKGWQESKKYILSL